MPAPKPLDLKLDVVFKILFAAPEPPDSLCLLLTAAPMRSSPFFSVDVLNAALPKELMTDKGAVVVLHVELAQGSLPDVQMQAQPRQSVRGWALHHGDRILGLKARQ